MAPSISEVSFRWRLRVVVTSWTGLGGGMDPMLWRLMHDWTFRINAFSAVDADFPRGLRFGGGSREALAECCGPEEVALHTHRRAHPSSPSLHSAHSNCNATSNLLLISCGKISSISALGSSSLGAARARSRAVVIPCFVKYGMTSTKGTSAYSTREAREAAKAPNGVVSVLDPSMTQTHVRVGRDSSSRV